MIPNVHYLQSLLASHAHRHPLRNILPFSHRVTYTDWYPLFRANNTVFLVHIKPFPKVSLAQGPHRPTLHPPRDLIPVVRGTGFRPLDIVP